MTCRKGNLNVRSCFNEVVHPSILSTPATWWAPELLWAGLLPMMYQGNRGAPQLSKGQIVSEINKTNKKNETAGAPPASEQPAVSS